MATVTAIGVSVLGVTALRACLDYGAAMVSAHLEEDIVRQLRIRLHEHVLRLSPEAFAGKLSGELGARVAVEINQVRSLLRLGTVAASRQILTALSLAGLALWLDPPIALAGIAVVPPLAWLTARVARRSRTAAASSWQAQAAIAGAIAERAGLLPVVRAYAAEGRIHEKFLEETEEARALSIEAARSRARLAPLLEVAIALGALPLLALVGWRIETGHPVETYVALLAAILLMFRPVRALAGIAGGVAAGLAALDRVAQIFELPAIEAPGERPDLPPMEEQLELEAVTFRHGDREVLRGVDLRVRRGESLAVVGESGAGKTTLLQLLVGLRAPSSGRILLDGREVAAASVSSFRRQLAWVSQEPLLFSDSVIDNVALGCARPDRARVEEACRAAGAHDFVALLPMGYDTKLEEGGGNLSQGERQRLCLARALYRDARVLVLDEPTASLDAGAERALSETIEALLAERRTVVVATHRESTVRRADRVVVLSEGAIVDEGEPLALGDRSGSYRSLFARP